MGAISIARFEGLIVSVEDGANETKKGNRCITVTWLGPLRAGLRAYNKSDAISSLYV